MKIKRINDYQDPRFSTKVLNQHGAFVLDDLLYEVEIISNHEAIIRGNQQYYQEIIEEFRYYTEHIDRFYNENLELVVQYEPVDLFNITISNIQPSQFYVDQDKMNAIFDFIHVPEDIIIPLIKYNGRYVSLDGHTRLLVAIHKGYKHVKGFITEGDDDIKYFVEETMKRGIYSPYNLELLSHDEYNSKWNQFCDDFFNNQSY